MKTKSVTLFLFITIFVAKSVATTFYVDPTGGNNTKDGLSWSNAVADITTAITKANTAPYDVTVEDILVKQGTMSFAISRGYTSMDNIFGSCAGTESSPAERPTVDVDGNGKIEPWEFQYPTIFTSTLAASNSTATIALTLNLTNATFNGFTIIHNPNSSSFLSKNIYCSNATTTFENNIIRNCNNTSSWTTGSQLGLILQSAGIVKNCLIEKNQVYVTSVMNSSGLSPIMSLTAGAKLLNCVFRNNKVTVDYSAAVSTNSSASLKGMIVNAESGLVGATTVIANTLVYNNESVYIPGTGTLATLTNGATVSLSGTTGAANTDSIINCTVANNSTTKMATAGLSAQKVAAKVNYVLNNTLWNNQNDGVVKNILVNSTLTSGLVANNVYNGGSTGLTVTPTYVVDNVNDLDNLNTTSIKGAQFVNPTTFVGVNRVPESLDSIAIAHANWSINSNSYLIGKGVTLVGHSLDFIGELFLSSPAVGAYEYVAPIATSVSDKSTSFDLGLFTVLGNRIVVGACGYLTVFSIQGAEIKKLKVTAGESIVLNKGCYIIQLTADNGTVSNKIVL